MNKIKIFNSQYFPKKAKNVEIGNPVYIKKMKIFKCIKENIWGIYSGYRKEFGHLVYFGILNVVEIEPEKFISLAKKRMTINFMKMVSEEAKLNLNQLKK